MGTWERSSQRVADNQAVKLIGNGISAGSLVVGSTIKLGQQGINCTIDVGRRSVNAANSLVGMGVDRCLDVTEAVVTYMLPEHEDDDSMDEPLLTPNPTDNAKKERRRRRQLRRQRRELHKARRSHLLKANESKRPNYCTPVVMCFCRHMGWQVGSCSRTCYNYCRS